MNDRACRHGFTECEKCRGDGLAVDFEEIASKPTFFRCVFSDNNVPRAAPQERIFIATHAATPRSSE
jgi:hypothetical protein